MSNNQIMENLRAASKRADKSREFSFSAQQFSTIVDLVNKHSGIQLGEGKEELVYSRMVRRIRALGLSSFDQYLAVVQDSSGKELTNFINAITTNLTSFFREAHHFDYLRSTLLPQLLIDNQNTKKLRIWSAGCSSGEEPYSIAMTVRPMFPPDWDIKILATDLDTDMVAHSQAGIYDATRITGVKSAIKQRWFKKGIGDKAKKVKVSPELQKMITFKPLNLLRAWPITGPFDFIFCRNVIIYFDAATKISLADRYANILSPKGHLFIGHSETLFNISDRYNLIGSTIYQKKQ